MVNTNARALGSIQHQGTSIVQSGCLIPLMRKHWWVDPLLQSLGPLDDALPQLASFFSRKQKPTKVDNLVELPPSPVKTAGDLLVTANSRGNAPSLPADRTNLGKALDRAKSVPASFGILPASGLPQSPFILSLEDIQSYTNQSPSTDVAAERPNGVEEPSSSPTHLEDLWDQWWREPVLPKAAAKHCTSGGESRPLQHQGWRLSLRHGATSSEIRNHVKQLRRSILHKISTRTSIWTPFTPQVEQCFNLGRELGSGHYGVVRLCQDSETGETFACKTIKNGAIKTIDRLDELCAEVLSMLRVQESCSCGESRGWIKIHEVFDEAEAVHIIMDFCEGGDLFDFINSHREFNEEEAAHLLKQLAEAALHMHSAGVIHRDLKPENILLTKTGICTGFPEVKLADFGLSAELSSKGWARGVAGSPHYMAPEVIKNKWYDGKVDVWSLGVLMYVCLSGRLPYRGESACEVFKDILMYEPDFANARWHGISEQGRDLVQQMLQKDPQKRISMFEVLLHPWMHIFAGTGSSLEKHSCRSQQSPPLLGFFQGFLDQQWNEAAYRESSIFWRSLSPYHLSPQFL